MIPLRKFDERHHLHGATIRWLAHRCDLYRDARERSGDVGRYQHDYSDRRVKDALRDETHRKCAYCESKYRKVAFGDVEHILPRANDPDRILNYANLTIACAICNNNKSDYEDPAMPLLDPYSDDPRRRLVVCWGHIFPRPGTDGDKRALNTIEVFELNLRPELSESRHSIAEKAFRLADDYEAARTKPLRRMAERLIVEMCQPTAEHALVARTIFATHLRDFPLPALD